MIRKLKKGFTLVELVVVIAVIAILAAVSVVSYLSVTKKSKESNDHLMIDQINLSVASTSIPNRKATVHQMLEDLKENAGFGVEKIKPELEGTEFVYSYSMNKFAYWKNNDVVYPEDVKNNSSARGTDLWFFVDLDSNGVLANGHSYYLRSSQSEEVTTDGGLDVGGCTTISSINLTRTTKAANDIVIRSNSAGTKITVDAVSDTVHHYDLIGEVDVVKTADGSFHEYGTAGYVQVASGRVVAENGGSIATVLLTEKGEGATLPAVLQIKQGGIVNNKYATSNDVASANNGAANDPYQLNLLPSSSEGGNILVADDGKTIEETIQRIKVEAVSEVTPDPYAKIVADGLELGAYYAVLKEDKTLYGYELPSVFSDQHYTILMIQDYATDDFFAVVNNSTITLDLNGTDFEITNPEGIGVFGESNLTLDVIDNKGTGSITLKSICLLGSTNTITFNNVNFVFNNEGDGIIANEGKLYFDGGNYTFNGGSRFEDFRGMLGISSSSLKIKECKINIDPTSYVDGNVYNITFSSGIYTVSAK